MRKTLVKESSIVPEKIKFFLLRMVTYLLFVSIPYVLNVIPKNSNLAIISISTFSIIFFIMQWFLIGKEIDYRFNIFIRFNSSIEKIIYRIFLGQIITIIVFNFFYLLPFSITKDLFWSFWFCFGLFHSWPTRGKIITESVSSHLYEYKFLDKFEKIVVLLIIIFFIVSLPSFSGFSNPFTLRLNYDHSEIVSASYWNYLYVNYLPFLNHPKLLGIVWNTHLYIVNSSLILGVLYITSRYFFSRRLALLCILTLVSSWQYYQIIENNVGVLLYSGCSLLFLWAIILAYNSSTYRIGGFLGLFAAYMVFINMSFFIPVIGGIFYLFVIFLHDRNKWFKLKFIKHISIGGIFIALYLLSSEVTFLDLSQINHNFFKLISSFYYTFLNKSFFYLSFFGVVIIFISSIKKTKISKYFFIHKYILIFSFVYISFVILLQIILVKFKFLPLGPLWIMSILSIVPLELLFNKMRAYKSNLNLFYGIYLLAILLDSHVEIRIRHFVNMLLS